jgi:hypothetical protein
LVPGPKFSGLPSEQKTSVFAETDAAASMAGMQIAAKRAERFTVVPLSGGRT